MYKKYIIYSILFVQLNSIQVYLHSAFHDANLCKAALQKMKVSTLYLVIAYSGDYLKLMSI